jgi:hypothetical protein
MDVSYTASQKKMWMMAMETMAVVVAVPDRTYGHQYQYYQC